MQAGEDVARVDQVQQDAFVVFCASIGLLSSDVRHMLWRCERNVKFHKNNSNYSHFSTQ